MSIVAKRYHGDAPAVNWPALMIEPQSAPLTIEHADCANCHYPLRGLSFDGRCPECGESISYSIARYREQQIQNPLWQADRRWVRELFQGAVAALASILLRAVAVLV